MAKHAGSGIAGKNKAKCDRYRQQERRLANKLKRIRRSNGRKARDYYQRKMVVREIPDHMPRTRGPVPLWQIKHRQDAQHRQQEAQ